jgi:predicted nucleic acid-binding protein
MNTLIDTSAWIEALRSKGKTEIREKVKELLVSGEARITEPILLELFHGARGKQEIETIKELSETVPILKCGESIYSLSYQNAIALRSRGVTVPSMDILIFSVSDYYKVKLLHNDSDFVLIQEKLKR